MLRAVVATCAVAALLTHGAYAQSYPVKPVRVIIPWPAGGSNDVVGRIVLQKLVESMGQQFVVDNRAGASGSIGADVVAKAPPDGYTLMVHSTTHVGNGHLYRKLPYDTLKDFAAVGLLSSQPGVLTVHPSLPVRTVKEFIALARARPGEILYSSSGNGSAPHLSMALFASMAKVSLVHVPYKGGPPQVTALVAGEAQASLATIATVVTHIRDGRLRALGVSSAKPSSTLPGVPPIGSSGVPGYEMSPWIGVFAPAGTPKNIIDRLNAEINKALAMRDVQQKLESQALDPWPTTPEEMSKRLKIDYDKYGRLIELTGAKVEYEPQESPDMPLPVWMLLGFAVWTVLLLLATVGVYRWSRILTGRVAISEFRGDRVEGDDWYKRAMRAHANCVENLPVFGAIVLAVYAAEITGPAVDALSAAVLGGRVMQSLVHVAFVQTNAVTSLRFVFFFVQIASFLALAAIIVGRMPGLR